MIDSGWRLVQFSVAGWNLDEDHPDVCGGFPISVVHLKCTLDRVDNAVADRHEGCGCLVPFVGMVSELGE
jgi:hypothetical protein